MYNTRFDINVSIYVEYSQVWREKVHHQLKKTTIKLVFILVCFSLTCCISNEGF